MPIYMDADIAVAQITRLKDNDSSKYDLGLDTAINEIKHHMPTADVVEIVRCRDCKKHDWCSIEDLALNDETFFCKWGERREDETV